MTWRWWKRQDPSIIRFEQRNERRATQEARQARESADRKLAETERRGVEVNRVAGLLRNLRQDNNFGALIEASMLRRR